MTARVALLLLAGTTLAHADFTPPPATAVTHYTAAVLPCSIARTGGRARVECTGALLESKTLRELAILRNTIYARYGWDGYRKEWLKTYFHAQPWFKPNPKFSYRLLSDADKQNAHFLGVAESSLTEAELKKRMVEIKKKETLGADDKVEIALLGRAMGNFSVDDDEVQSESEWETALDKVLKVQMLRKLSLRDLRLLRNTIYARRGRKFKSPILQDHFDGMGWYKIDPSYSDKLLTKNDERNIGLVKSVENEFGGPMTDEAMLKEAATDGA